MLQWMAYLSRFKKIDCCKYDIVVYIHVQYSRLCCITEEPLKMKHQSPWDYLLFNEKHVINKYAQLLRHSIYSFGIIDY